MSSTREGPPWTVVSQAAAPSLLSRGCWEGSGPLGTTEILWAPRQDGSWAYPQECHLGKGQMRDVTHVSPCPAILGLYGCVSPAVHWPSRCELSPQGEPLHPARRPSSQLPGSKLCPPLPCLALPPTPLEALRPAPKPPQEPLQPLPVRISCPRCDFQNPCPFLSPTLVGGLDPFPRLLGQQHLGTTHTRQKGSRPVQDNTDLLFASFSAVAGLQGQGVALEHASPPRELAPENLAAWNSGESPTEALRGPLSVSPWALQDHKDRTSSRRWCQRRAVRGAFGVEQQSG